jgi:hypothetical protein
MKALRPWGFAALLVLHCSAVACAAAGTASPRAELLRLVPDDVGFCLVVSDLRAHLANIQGAPWMKRFRASPLGQALTASPEMGKLTKLDGDLQRTVQVSLARLANDIFGDAVVFAYRPGPAGKPDEEQGLLLLFAHDADLLSQLVSRVNKVQQQTGELKALEAREYHGVRYWRRQEARAEHFYLLRGPLLVLGRREVTLRQVIDRQKAPLASRAAAGLRGAEDALLSLWLNPRAYDEDLRQKAAAAAGPEARVLDAFRTCWRALDGLTLALQLDKDLELRVALQGRSSGLTPAVRQLLETAAQPSEVWACVPQEAMLTVAGRLDFPAANKILTEALTPEAQEAARVGLQRTVGAALGMDLFRDVLPRLGPDWGCCVAPAPDATGFPHVVCALRIQPGPGEAPVDQAIYKALEFFARLAVLEHNHTHRTTLALKKLQEGGVDVQYLTGAGAFLPGLEPSFALKEGFLVLGSSPAAVARFARGHAGPRRTSEVPVLRVSFPMLAQYVEARRQTFVSFLAQKEGVSTATGGAWLDGLLRVLRLANRLELTQRVGQGQVVWTLRLSTENRRRD